MVDHRTWMRAVAAEAALAAVIGEADRRLSQQEKMIEDGRAGLQRIVDAGLDADLRGVVDCGFALGIALKIDMSTRPETRKRKRGGA